MKNSKSPALKALCLALLATPALASAAQVTLYGVVDEIHQSFTPGRSSSVFDWLADTAGGFLGACAFVLFVSIFFWKRND